MSVSALQSTTLKLNVYLELYVTLLPPHAVSAVDRKKRCKLRTHAEDRFFQQTLRTPVC